MEKTFRVTVECISGGTRHTHTLVVEPGSGVLGASRPSNVRLQYTCPATRESLAAIFSPPLGAGRPFRIVEVGS